MNTTPEEVRKGRARELAGIIISHPGARDLCDLLRERERTPESGVLHVDCTRAGRIAYAADLHLLFRNIASPDAVPHDQHYSEADDPMAVPDTLSETQPPDLSKVVPEPPEESTEE
jgi:hypothetical protein